ncbi:hypothetical protein [Calothrix rhizosoleniae]|uniref:hypothetical protein n=1 Tax=Calothrix rhizosoleniae TaxID=888997 RepID=UPI001356467A|nr:hypothetical protein [Calothrix rhizosoleniae]
MNPRKPNIKDVVVLLLVVGTGAIAISDTQFRAVFGDLAKVGVGGYLGQLMPEATP